MRAAREHEREMAAGASRFNGTGLGLTSSIRSALEFSIAQLRGEAAQPAAVAA